MERALMTLAYNRRSLRRLPRASLRGVARAVLASAALAVSCPAAGWRVKEDCRLVPNPANDGDSFHAKSGRSTYIFRLYFVDAPETDRLVPERVAEQASYWGIAEDDVLRTGREAARFAEDFLKDGFTVHTKFTDAMGRSEKDRIYGWVEARGTTLAEALVGAGLARVYGLQVAPEDGPDPDLYAMRLRRLEREAKAARRGAWAFVPAAGPPLTEQAVRVARHIQVLAPDTGRLLGLLTPGATVTVLRADSATHVRIRLPAAPGAEPREGLCRRDDLGL
jgi:endonuclease YncB( thermonuclease family)